jgi:ectoine hydroxylase-related dioxygenase (phytanoyl-CoA dioxygenase family)
MDGNGFDSSSYSTGFARDGYACLPRVLSDSAVDEIRAAIDRVPPSEAVRRKTRVYGIRNLLEIVPEVAALAVRPEIWQFVTPILGEAAFATRAILFNKTPDANWALGWHQDSVISVARQIETPGFCAWGQKAGVWQVQPPPEILSRMLALRIQLDDCSADNGALRVIPGSHRHGWLDGEIAAWKARVPEVICEAPSGGVVAICPLILHASSRSVRPVNRRVVHIEYANESLPNGLAWHRKMTPMSLQSSHYST